MRLYNFLNEISNLDVIKDKLKSLGYKEFKMKGKAILAMSSNWRKGREEELGDIASALNGIYIKGKTPVSSQGHVEVTINNEVIRIGVKPITAQNPTKYEDVEVNSLNKQLQELGAPIKITALGKEYTILDVKPIKGTPKADFALFDPQGNPEIFISHKASHGFQQYSGVSEKGAGSNISNHPEVKAFYDAVLQKTNEMKSGEGYYRPIKDKGLKLLAVWGPDYGKSFGINNVQYFIQGSVKIIKKGSNYELAGKILKNGELPTGEFEPVLYIYNQPSGSGWNKIKNGRAVIHWLGTAGKKELI